MSNRSMSNPSNQPTPRGDPDTGPGGSTGASPPHSALSGPPENKPNDPPYEPHSPSAATVGGAAASVAAPSHQAPEDAGDDSAPEPGEDSDPSGSSDSCAAAAAPVSASDDATNATATNAAPTRRPRPAARSDGHAPRTRRHAARAGRVQRPHARSRTAAGRDPPNRARTTRVIMRTVPLVWVTDIPETADAENAGRTIVQERHVKIHINPRGPARHPRCPAPRRRAARQGSLPGARDLPEHQAHTEPSMAARTSARWRAQAAGVAASRLRRSRGSVLEGRRLNHQSPQSTVRPSRRSWGWSR